MTGKTRGIAFVGAFAALTAAGVMAFGDASNAGGQTKTADSGMSKTQKVSYTIGYQIGKSFVAQGVDIDVSSLKAGVLTGMGKQKMQLTEKQMQAVMMAFRQEMMQKMQAKNAAEAKANAKASAAMLAANAKKPGVHVTKSGLQYKILKKGSGQSPTASDTVQVNYTGTLPNGKKFDASADHPGGGPAEFELDRVIPGWSEALGMMKPGAKWRIWIPAKLAYGAQGPRGIGPNQALVFDVQLVKVEKKSDKASQNSSGGDSQNK